MTRASRVACGLSAVALAACNHPALTSLAGRACDATPRLMPAKAVKLGDFERVRLDETSPCLLLPQGATTYAVFQLPAYTIPAQITVASEVTGSGTVLPIGIVYDGAGQRRRQVAAASPDAGLQSATRMESADRYVVVAADPAFTNTNHPAGATPAGPVQAVATAQVTVPFGTAAYATQVMVPLAFSGSVLVYVDPIRAVP